MYNSDDLSAERTACGCARRRCGCSGVQSESRQAENASQSGCGVNAGSTWGLVSFPLAMAYAPLQNFEDIYDCENALVRGTIFRELDLPFVCGGMSGGVSRG